MSHSFSHFPSTILLLLLLLLLLLSIILVMYYLLDSFASIPSFLSCFFSKISSPPALTWDIIYNLNLLSQSCDQNRLSTKVRGVLTEYSLPLHCLQHHTVRAPTSSSDAFAPPWLWLWISSTHKVPGQGKPMREFWVGESQLIINSKKGNIALQTNVKMAMPKQPFQRNAPDERKCYRCKS